MTAEEVRARYLISEAAWATMRAVTLEVHDVTGEVVALAVRGVPSFSEPQGEDSDEFFYDVDWLQWFKFAYPGRSIVGSMAPVDQDTEEAFVWFIALD